MSEPTKTSMDDHIQHFWNAISEPRVRILVDMRRDHDDGSFHWDSSSFGDDVAKALLGSGRAAPRTNITSAAVTVDREHYDALIKEHQELTAIRATAPSLMEPVGSDDEENELVWRLEHPAWSHSLTGPAQLDKEPAVADMRRAAAEIKRLSALAAPTALADQIDPASPPRNDDSLLLTIHALIECHGRLHPDRYVPTFHRNIVLGFVAGALRGDLPPDPPPPEVIPSTAMSEPRTVTDTDREYASELLADLANTGENLSRSEKAARWFRKARVEHSLRATPTPSDASVEPVMGDVDQGRPACGQGDEWGRRPTDPHYGETKR